MAKQKAFKGKLKDCESGEEVELKTMARADPEMAFSGPVHTTVATTHPKYQAASNEKVISQNGASIVFGTDRKDTLVSGFGGEGLPSECVDVVVGRLAGAPDENGLYGSPKNCLITGPNFNADAARMYISRLTDVDLYFGIDVKESGTKKAHSGVGIKADQVRLVGREGVKIVTGRMKLDRGEEVNSLGGKIPVAPKIDLMAGNDVTKLQPIVKGDNLNACLLELGGFVDSNSSRIEMLENALVSVMAGLAAEPFLATTKVLGPTVTTAIQVFGKNPGYQNRINKTLWEINYLTRPDTNRIDIVHGKDLPAIPGARYICSTNVRAS